MPTCWLPQMSLACPLNMARATEADKRVRYTVFLHARCHEGLPTGLQSNHVSARCFGKRSSAKAVCSTSPNCSKCHREPLVGTTSGALWTSWSLTFAASSPRTKRLGIRLSELSMRRQRNQVRFLLLVPLTHHSLPVSSMHFGHFRLWRSTGPDNSNACAR